MTNRLAVRAVLCAALLTGSAALAACGDDLFRLNWSADPDTVLIYSLARPEINLPTAFDFARREAIEIHEPGATGEWDILLDTEGGQLVMKVPEFFGISSEARVSVIGGMSFDEVLEAPEDTAAYVANDPIPVELGNTYVIQTHLAPDRFGQRCHFFAKMEPLALDVQLGTMRFVFDRNPLCEDLELVPPEN